MEEIPADVPPFVAVFCPSFSHSAFFADLSRTSHGKASTNQAVPRPPSFWESRWLCDCTTLGSDSPIAEDLTMSVLLVIALLIILPFTLLMAIEFADQYKHPYRRRENNQTGVRSR
jgi:hypothetical protein